MNMHQDDRILTPDCPARESFMDAEAAVSRLEALYTQATRFLFDHFSQTLTGEKPKARIRAFYPEVRITTTSHATADSRLSFGHVPVPGTYTATITRPDLFRNYLVQQLDLLIRNHGVPVFVGPSTTPIPVHFAMTSNPTVAVPQEGVLDFPLRDIFDVPDLTTTNDDIVNGTARANADGSGHLAPFTAQRVDYSLARLSHYTATLPEHFQNHVLFTNYQFYVDEFEAFARSALADPASGYTSFVSPGNVEIRTADEVIPALTKLPQMPTYHLKRRGGQGITLVNIGVGPSNAKNITDHLAVLRPHCWLMIGHCGGLRQSQHIGDYVLASAYMRADRVMEEVLPAEVPVIPNFLINLALRKELQDAQMAYRMGTVYTTDNRNWEFNQNATIGAMKLSRSIAVDMESATIAANGYRYRIPHATLLCVSDKPLHGRPKLSNEAQAFYKNSKEKHLEMAIRAVENLRAQYPGGLPNDDVRSFDEPLLGSSGKD